MLTNGWFLTDFDFVSKCLQEAVFSQKNLTQHLLQMICTIKKKSAKQKLIGTAFVRSKHKSVIHKI